MRHRYGPTTQKTIANEYSVLYLRLFLKTSIASTHEGFVLLIIFH